MWKRGEIAPQEQFLLFSTLFFIYISNFRSQITYSFVKCVVRFIVFLTLSTLIWISRSVSVSPLEFEITRVDCFNMNNKRKSVTGIDLPTLDLVFLLYRQRT